MLDISKRYAISPAHMAKKSPDEDKPESSEKGVLIFLKPELLKELTVDAKRCKRKRVRQIEAIIAAYYGYNVDIGDMSTVRASVGASVSSIRRHVETSAPQGRGAGAVEGTWSGEGKACPTCGDSTTGFICPSCGSPVVDAEFLSKTDLDQLPFGVIKLAVDGTILKFNKHEREVAHVGDKKLVSKNFFTEVAPCTKVKAFRDRFKKFLAGKQPSDNFEFTYTFPSGAAHVFILFFRESESIGYIVSTRAGEQRAEDTG
jgi:photoactive yellow protein